MKIIKIVFLIYYIFTKNDVINLIDQPIYISN